MQTPVVGRAGRSICVGSCVFVVAACLFALAAVSQQIDSRATSSTVPHSVLGRHSQARTAGFLRGRGVEGLRSSASSLIAARQQHLALAALPRSANLSAEWTPVGPGQIANPVYGSVTGRVTAIAIDPADTSNNTVYVGTTGGGVWKSTNAAGPATAVSFVPLTDGLAVFNAGSGSAAVASLSIGALAIGNGVLLAGTGDPNDATDSYYGSGILRSTDGGLTWILASQAAVGTNGSVSFAGLSVAGLAFSSTNPSIVVAAISESVEGSLVEASNPAYSVLGLYVSTDAGQTWQLSTVMDSSQIVQQGAYLGGSYSAATAVVWNPVRQRFYAAVRSHGYYESADGLTWNRLLNQPAIGMTLQNCPTLGASAACPLFRGALAVQPVSGDTFALTVDLNNHDSGLFQDVCALSGTACATSTATFANRLDSAPLEVGGGGVQIFQGDYNLSLAAVQSGADTLLFAGTVDLYRCSLASGCVLRNTTNAQDGCATPAAVAGAQHAIAAVGTLSFFGNDGGLWRSTDGVTETGSVCSASDASHFDNLNGGLGSLAEVVSFAQDPMQPGTLLAGLGALGSAGTASATSVMPWVQMSTGEGGTVAIDQQRPRNWYVATGPGVNIGLCAKGPACGLSDFGNPALAAAQVDSDPSRIDAPWLLDSQDQTQMLIGTCRVWRGPAVGGAGWPGNNLLSSPFGEPLATGCSGSGVVRSLASGGPANAAGNSPGLGSEVLYAGLTAGQGAASGHLFTTAQANTNSAASPWTDAALAPVTNAASAHFQFNPGGFDLSSIATDPHDAIGATLYVAVMGFAGNGVNAAHLYRSSDAGQHWLNVSSNLPNAPANSVLVDPNDANTVYVALDTGVYVTTSITTCASAACWSVFGSSLPNAPVLSLSAAARMPTGDARTGELRAGTYGRGIWQIPLLTATAPAVPAISLDPQQVTFPTQQVGTVSSPATVVVTDTGTAALAVTQIVTSSGFAEADSCQSAPIAPAATCSISVQFAPTMAGSVSGVLTVYGNVIGGQATASLTGVATAAGAIVLTPLALVFPSTTVGSISALLNLTIANTGGSPVGLASIAVDGNFAILANTCGSALAPSTGCTVSLAFQPSASGARTGTLTVTDDAGTQVAQLSGAGTSPATDSLSPLALTFPPQQLSTASPAQAITLANSGDQPLHLIVAMTAGAFSVVNGCGAVLPGHSTCSLPVSYIPSSIGQESGLLTVADEFRSQTVTLNGTGLAPPGVSLSPSGGLSFPLSPVGQSTASQTVTLSNTGGIALAITSATASGDFTVLGSTCGTSLAPATACTLQIAFSPTAAGERAGLLSVSDSAPTSPQTLSLSGTGIDFALAVNGPVSLSIASGQTANYLLLLTSSPGVPGDASFNCSGLPAAAFCSVNPAAPPLYTANGTVITVTVSTGQTHALQMRPMLRGDPLIWLCLLLPPSMFSRRRTRRAALTSLMLLALIACGTVGRTIPGDGGGGGNTPPPVTPSGSYTLQVAGSSAGLTRSVNLTLVIQ